MPSLRGASLGAHWEPLRSSRAEVIVAHRVGVPAHADPPAGAHLRMRGTTSLPRSGGPHPRPSPLATAAEVRAHRHQRHPRCPGRSRGARRRGPATYRRVGAAGEGVAPAPTCTSDGPPPQPAPATAVAGLLDGLPAGHPDRFCRVADVRNWRRRGGGHIASPSGERSSGAAWACASASFEVAVSRNNRHGVVATGVMSGSTRAAYGSAPQGQALHRAVLSTQVVDFLSRLKAEAAGSPNISSSWYLGGGPASPSPPVPAPSVCCLLRPAELG